MKETRGKTEKGAEYIVRSTGDRYRPDRVTIDVVIPGVGHYTGHVLKIIDGVVKTDIEIDGRRLALHTTPEINAVWSYILPPAPEVVERREIAALFARAEARRNDSDDNNIIDAMRLRNKAEQMLAAWREKYPEAAKAEEKARLLAEASDLRSKAQDAMAYDMDGWLTNADQQARHDDYIRRAKALEAKAAEISR